MPKKLDYTIIELTEKQKEELRDLAQVILLDAEKHEDGVSRMGIMAQVMTTVENDMYLIAAVVPEDMVNKIREITGADKR